MANATNDIINGSKPLGSFNKDRPMQTPPIRFWFKYFATQSIVVPLLVVNALSGCAGTGVPSASSPVDIRLLAGGDTASLSQGTLYLVDGKRIQSGTTPNLTHGDIAGVEVMKPPAAEQIFGREARDGIVRITTKAHAIPPSSKGCQPAKDPYFEYQVNRPALYLTTDIKFPQPTTASALGVAKGTGLVVQVVVDTLGLPDVRSFKILHSPNETAAAAVRHAFLGWRFIPATFQGCKVPQLVQTEVAR
jgi:hypothetical protein